MKKRMLSLISVICFLCLGISGCGGAQQADHKETEMETSVLEIASEEVPELPEVTISTVKYMLVNADGGLTLREGPSTDYTAVYLINNRAQILASDFQDNWAFTQVDGYEGWCCTDYLQDYEIRVNIQGPESSAFSEMKSYMEKTVGDIKAEYGENYTSEVRGKSAPHPCMIYAVSDTPYIFYYRRADGVQGGHDNASDNTDIIRFVACETSGIPIVLNVEIGDSFEIVEEKIGVSLETKPFTGPGIEKPYTEVYATVLYNGYNVRMVFDDMTQTLVRITLADKNQVFIDD